MVDTIKVLDSSDILDALNTAVEAAPGQGRTTRQCYYVEYDVAGDGEYNTIETDRLEAYVVKVAAERGVEDRYNMETDADFLDCLPARPHCIVGTVLSDLGVPLSALARFESESCNAIYHDRDRIGRDYGVKITDEGWDLLAKAQAVQDGGSPWGIALQATEERHQRIEEHKADGNVEPIILLVDN